MSTIAIKKIKTPYDGSGMQLYSWIGMANGDDGEPLNISHFADKSIQVLGTFGAGGNLRIEGSNMLDSPTYATLADAQGNALDFTAAKIEQVLESPYWIRPRVTAGDGTTALDVYVLCGTSR